MSQGRHGIKILGLSLLAAISLLVIVVGVAQAEEFKLATKTFTAEGTAQETVLGSVGAGELLTASGLKIWCETGEIKNTTVLLGGGAHAEILYNTCEVLGNKNCLIFESKMEAELDLNHGHIVAKGLGSVIKHELGSTKEYYLKVESSGSPFSTVWIANTAGKKLCTLPLENPVTGSTAFFLEAALTESLTHTLKTLTTAQTELLNLNAGGTAGLNLKLQLLYGAENADLEVGTTASVNLENDAMWSVE